MKVEKTITILKELKEEYKWVVPNLYYEALDEAIKRLDIFKDMFEGARMTNHKENDDEYTAI